MWDDVGRAIRRNYDGRCDGVILLAPQPQSELVRTLWERGIPLVSVGNTLSLPGVSVVDIDNESASEQLTRHRLGLSDRFPNRSDADVATIEFDDDVAAAFETERPAELCGEADAA